MPEAEAVAEYRPTISEVTRWVVTIHPELVGNLGKTSTVAVCELQETAERIAGAAVGISGPLGCLASAYQFLSVDGIVYGPAYLLPIMRPSEEDPALRASRAAREEAIRVARAAGLDEATIATLLKG